MPTSVSQSTIVSNPALAVLAATPATLRPTATGADVQRLQRLLAGKGYQVAQDGKFGAGTEAAVKAFQTANGLTADGVVGARTWQLLMGSQSQTQVGRPAAPTSGTQAQAPISGPSSGATLTLRVNARGPEVMELQQLLNAKGYNVGTPDGKFGSGTLAQVQRFQASLGMEADGVVGRRTWEALRGTSSIDTPPPSTGSRSAPRYFIFASATGSAGVRNGEISARDVEETVAKYGSNVLIGIDTGSDYQSIVRAAKDKGARLNAYVEGPGGATAGDWDEGEVQRTMQRARSQGISVPNSSASSVAAQLNRGEKPAWLREWNSTGWKTFAFSQLAQLKRDGFESVEIDNMENGLSSNSEPTPQQRMSFYKEYASRWERGQLPRLMLKNLSEDHLRALKSEIDRGTLKREMFADFHIAEWDVGDRAEITRLGKAIGIATYHAKSDAETKKYRAYQAYDA